MQNTERQKFEENWKSAFDGAEMTPPENVWNSIELDLAGQESAAMRKRVVFYQRLAAAMVLFVLMIGVYEFYPRTEVTRERGGEMTKAKGEEVTKGGGQELTNQSTPQVILSTGNTKHQTSNTEHQSVVSPEEPTFVVVEEETEQEQEQDQSPVAKRDTTTNAIANPPLQTAPLVATLEEPQETEKKNTHPKSLWLALGASAGNYTPNSSSANAISSGTSFSSGPQSYDVLKAASPKSGPKVGSSYSVGILVGKKIGRVVLQTGINMNRQQISYISNYDSRIANESKAAVSDYLAANSSTGAATSLSYTNEYTVNSTMEIISIPVQVGYLIVDRKLQWQVNTGVSSDFFLRNVLVDESGTRGKFTQEAGSQSPYRSTNWSALMNTELSYRLGPHYRFSLVPGVRYSFNPILKNSGDSGRPLVLDVGFRLKYLFN